MDPETERNGPINLSTSQRLLSMRPATPVNETHSISELKERDSMHDSPSARVSHMANGAGSSSSGGSSSNNSPSTWNGAADSDGTTASVNPLLQSLALQQHMQQLLRQQLVNPEQLHTLVQQQQQNLLLYHRQQQQKFNDLGRKQLETVMQQIQEQIQVNLIQQSQLMQSQMGLSPTEKKKTGELLQGLVSQQQQLMQQLQLAQRHYLLGLQQHHMLTSPAASTGDEAVTEKRSSSWKDEVRPTEMCSSPASSPDRMSTHSSDMKVTNGRSAEIAVEKSSSVPRAVKERQHPLYHYGVCRWPGCETPCEDFIAFIEHLNMDHILDDRSTAQTRVQMQVVSQLELQLQKERDRLQAMMDHLNQARQQHQQQLQQQQQQQQLHRAEMVLPTPVIAAPPPPAPSAMIPGAVTDPGQRISPLAALVNATMRGAMGLTQQNHPQMMNPPTPSMPAPMRRRLGEKPNLTPPSGSFSADDIRLRKRNSSERSAMDISEGLPYLLDRAGLDVQQELQRNREFYRNADVRPPFTYASLIRQAIIESPEKQLTLNEIYTWFQNTFCYFRHNAATWKNAVRHNLSLHKCFMRVENVKGAVWTVDEVEFHKRRPQRSTSGGVQPKSPSMTPSPTLFGEALNASLQAALAESNMNFLHRNAAEVGSPMTGDRAAFEASEQTTPVKHVKVEDAEEVADMKSEDYYSMAAKRQCWGVGGNMKTDDGSDASSTENYEPINYKAWQESDDYHAAIGRTLMVEVAPVDHHDDKEKAPSQAEFLKASPAVNSA